jgi:ketosteroid isomerase-like protein
MSQANVEIAVRQFEIDGAADTWAEDVNLVLHGKFGAYTETRRGRIAVEEWFDDWFNQFGTDYRFEIEELRDAGDRVLVVARHHAHGGHSGVTVDQSGPFVFTMRDGKVSQIELWTEEQLELEGYSAEALGDMYARGNVSTEEFEAALERVVARDVDASSVRRVPRESHQGSRVPRGTDEEKPESGRDDRCGTCGSMTRTVEEWGQQATWCPGCQRYLDRVPRAEGGFAAAGGTTAIGYAESGPDLDDDGDVDGGLLDSLG